MYWDEMLPLVFSSKLDNVDGTGCGYCAEWSSPWQQLGMSSNMGFLVTIYIGNKEGDSYGTTVGGA